MLSFESDYTEGCVPEILERLAQTNLEQVSGYGHDKFCDKAKNLIRNECQKPNLQIQFICGGTQTNQIVIDSMLKPYEAVISADTGHINCHEAGAVEYTGHKVIPLPSLKDENKGKIETDALKKFLENFFADENNEHMVFPGMVYISHPTEYGTLYSKEELSDLSKICNDYKIPLFLDGARLGYALNSPYTDIKLKDITALTDVFYIGGTKCGALCGEAVVFTKNNMPEHFENLVKKHGALLAKGRLLGIQFETLFTDGLYNKICKNAVDLAICLREELKKKGIKFLIDSPTNQQFAILENKRMQELKQKVKFSFWEKHDENHTIVRFATSWATTKENVEKLIELI